MRHLKTGRTLGVKDSHRRAMMRSLALALIEHNGIKTTTGRAKELRRFAERIVTLGKKGDLNSRRRMVQLLGSTKTGKNGNRVRNAVDKVYAELVPRFKAREGGYTQVLKMYPFRAGDCADMSYIRYIPESLSKKAPKKKSSKAKKAAPKATDKKPAKKAAAKTAKKAAPKKAAKKGPEDKPAKSKK